MGKNTQPQKTGSTGRVLKTSLREFSSGGVVYKKTSDNILWLVRSTTTSHDFPTSYWMLPKGWIDNTEQDVPGPMASGKIKADEKSLQAAATREVEEEGGIVPIIVKKIGTEKYFFRHPKRGQILKFVTFYLMKYLRDTPNGHDNETGEVLWLPYEEAYKKLSFSGEKSILKKAKLLLDDTNLD